VFFFSVAMASTLRSAVDASPRAAWILLAVSFRHLIFVWDELYNVVDFAIKHPAYLFHRLQRDIAVVSETRGYVRAVTSLLLKLSS